MELDQLRNFIQIAEHGSFSRAAAMLDVNQPFLSRQISRLETELRRHLFFRHGRGVELTEAGQLLLVTARSVINQVDLISRHAPVGQDQLMGSVTIGLTPALSQSLAVPIVRRFTAQFPAAHIAIVETMSRELHERLLAGRVDAALLHDQPPSSLVAVEPLTTEVMCLLSPRHHPCAKRDSIEFVELARLPLMFPMAPHPLRGIVEAEAARQGVSLDIRYQVDGVETLLALVKEGFGHTIATPDVARAGRYSEALHATPIVSPSISTTISLATSTRQQPTTLHQLTLDIVRDVYREVFAGSGKGRPPPEPAHPITLPRC
jgi:LysR family nitrogen assimilation transcriptional regulator